jgi:hypothetical protein
MPMRTRSMVGLIPLCAVAVVDGAVLAKLPGFGRRLRYFRKERSELATLISRWDEPGADGRHLLALTRVFRMTKLLERMLDESEFLSPHGGGPCRAAMTIIRTCSSTAGCSMD